jgi:hypothetical protein
MFHKLYGARVKGKNITEGKIIVVSRDMCVTIDGFGLMNGFTDHLNTQLGTTSNYSATANLYNSQITITLAKPFPACCVFTSRFLATDSNSGDSSTSRSQVLSSQPPVQKSTEFTHFMFCL